MFSLLGSESITSLRSPRAHTIRRVSLADLNLADPDDVVRIVVLNAIFGNTDRHMGNLNYGEFNSPASPHWGQGVLLPFDHGRAGFNNRAVPAREIAGTPADAVTGRVWDGSNPHQLLRPFAELARRDRSHAEAVVTATASALTQTANALLNDPAWDDHAELLAALAARGQAIVDKPAALLDAATEVVVP